MIFVLGFISLLQSNDITHHKSKLLHTIWKQNKTVGMLYHADPVWQTHGEVLSPAGQDHGDKLTL